MNYVLEELDPVEQAYLEKFRAARTSDNEYTPWLAEGLTEAEYFKKLYLEMSKKVGLFENEVGKLKRYLEDEGAYCIKRKDGAGIQLWEAMEIAQIFARLDDLLP